MVNKSSAKFTILRCKACIEYKETSDDIAVSFMKLH